MFSNILVLVLLFIAISLVSGNNISACVGTAIGARVLSKKFALGLGALGFIVGLVTQGSNMLRTVNLILPSSASLSNPFTVSEMLFAIILLFSFGKVIRVPLSVTMSLVGLMIGVSIVRGASFDIAFVRLVVATWFVAPIAAIIGGFYCVRAFGMSQKPNKDFWHRITIYKVSLIVLSFLSAFVVGTNSLALIVALGGFNYVEVIVSILAMVFGSFYLSSGQIKRVGQDIFTLRYSNALATLLVSTILFEAATLLGVPLSSTQTLSSGVFGAAISYPKRYISMKPFLIVILGWVVAPIVSIGIGLLI